MRRLFALLVALAAAAFLSSAAHAGGWHHGPPCPDTFYWRMSSKAYAEWEEFGLFKGSWDEKHKVVRRHRGHGVVVKVWRPGWVGRCRYVR